MNRTVLIGSSSPPDIGSGIHAYVTQVIDTMLQQGTTVIYVTPPVIDTDFLLDKKYKHIAIGQDTDPVEAVELLQKIISNDKVDGIINNDHPFLQCMAPIVDCTFISIGHMSRTSVATLACFNADWLDYVVAISTDMFHTYITKFSLPVHKVPVIYNGVSDPYDDKFEPTLTGDHLDVIYAGGQGRNKGAYLLKKSLSDSKFGDLNVTIHWFGHMTEKYKDEIAKFDSVKVYGRTGRKEFIDVLKKCDLFLLPSASEGCPMAMLEAMSYGVVPIASDGIGAMQRLVIHGQEGYICRLKNWQQDMMNCIDDLISDNEKLLSMKSKAYKRFKEDFTSNITGSNLLSLIDQPIVDRKSKSECITLLKWHRPCIKGTHTAPILDRICIKIGYLRKFKSKYKV